MQIDRLFQIVYILLNKKSVTAKYLSEKFEVSHKLGLKLEECSKTRRAKKKSKQKQTGDK